MKFLLLGLVFIGCSALPSLAVDLERDASQARSQEQALQKFEQEIGAFSQRPPPQLSPAGVSLEPGFEDLSIYRSSGADLFASDNRIGRPFELQLTTRQLYFWGLESGLYLTPSWFLGASIGSADFMTPFFGSQTTVHFTMPVSKLSMAKSVSMSAQFNHSYNERRFFTRFFPANNSGFYLQFSLYKQDWPGQIHLKLQDYNQYAAAPSASVGQMKITFPDWSPDYGLGWMWVSSSGFSSGIGLVYTPKTNFEVTMSHDQAQDGSELYSSATQKRIGQAVLDRAPFLQRRISYLINFGTNF